MNLNEIYAKAKKETDAIKSLGLETANKNNVGSFQIDFNNTSKCPDFENLLPEYFTNKDGSKLMDKKTGEVFRLSQSFIASFREYLSENKCLYRLMFVSIERAAEKDFGTTLAMILGTCFEFFLTGAFDYWGRIPKLPKVYVGTKREKLKAEAARLLENVEKAKQNLKKLGYDLSKTDEYETDKKMVFKCIDGSMDLFFKLLKVIIDIKYSAVLYSKWSRYSWGKENIEDSFGKMLQSSMYFLLCKLNNKEAKKFIFIVFNNQLHNSGDFQPFNVNISEKRLNMLKWLLVDTAKLFQEKIDKDGFTENPSFDNCKGCPAKGCKVRQNLRDVVEVYI